MNATPAVDDNRESEHEALLSFMYLSPIGIVRSSLSGEVDMLNPLSVQLLMPIAGSAGVANIFDCLAGVAPELRNLVSSFDAERGPVCEGHRIVLSPDGERSKVLSCSIIKVNGSTLMLTFADITRQVEAERRARRHEAWLAGIFTSANDFAFFTLDADGRVDSWNESVERLSGLTEADVLGNTLDLFYAPDAVDPYDCPEHIALSREEGWHIHEGWCASRSGRRYAAQILVAVLREDDGDIAGYSVVIRDISERKISSDELTRLLTTDHLTGAANRAHFFQLAESALAKAKRLHRPLSFVMIDADHFKRINDTAGHQAGDRALALIVQTAQATLRALDVIARLGGEEFCLMLPGSSADDALAIAERVRAAVEASPLDTERGPIAVTVSAGVSTLQHDTSTLGELLAAADKALYTAKSSGRNCVKQHAS